MDQRAGPRTSPAWNTTAVTLGLAGASGLGVVVNLALIAGYGASAHGQITLVIATAYLGTLVCDLGLASKAGVRRIARLRDRRSPQLDRVVDDYLRMLFSAAGVGGVLVLLASPLLGPALGIPISGLWHAAIWLFAGAGLRACFMVFIGFERMGYLLVLSPAAELVRLAWTGLCIWNRLDLTWLYVGWSFSWLASLAICAGLMVRLLRQYRAAWSGSHRPRRAWPRWRRQTLRTMGHSLAYHVPLLSNQALGPTLFVLAGFMLKAFQSGANGDHGRADISVLRVCFSLALVIGLVSQGLATSLFPVYARGQRQGHTGEFTGIADKALRLLMAAALLGFGAYVAFGHLILGLIDAINSGPTNENVYTLGWPTLLILCAALGFEGFGVQMDQWLMSARHVGVVVRGGLAKIGLLVGAVPLGTWAAYKLGADSAVGLDLILGPALAVLLVTALVAGIRGWSTRNALGHGPSGPAWRGAVGLGLLTGLAAIPIDLIHVLALPVAFGLVVGLKLIKLRDIRVM